MLYRNTIYWNSLPTITNKEIRKDITRQQQLIRNMVLTNDESEENQQVSKPASIPCCWEYKVTPSIVRRKKYTYSVSLQQGQSLILHFSVYQHDVGFSAYFNSQPNEVEFINLLLFIASSE